jgi:hypothetical protein
VPFTGNSSYTGLAAFAIEQTVERDWSMVWTRAHPLFRVLDMNQSHFNRGFGVAGLKMLLSINGGDLDNPADGVTDTNETSEMTLNTTGGFSQAAYNFSHYRANYVIKESEATLAANGSRGDILEGKKKQFLESFKKAISDDAASTVADARENVLGIRQVLSTSNTVGGISQTTDPDWAAQVTTTYGPWALEAAEEKIDAIEAQGRQEPDIALAAYSSSGTNVYARYRSSIAPAERYENKDFKAKYGLKNFMHMGVMVVMDNRIPAGELLVLSTGSWYCYFQRKPKLHPLQRLGKTDAYEQVGTLWCALGCNDPASNGRVTGIL